MKVRRPGSLFGLAFSAMLSAQLFAGCAEDGLLGVSPDLVIEIELAPQGQKDLVVDFSDVVVTNVAKRNLILSNKGRRGLEILDAKYAGDKSFSYTKLPTALTQGETGKVIATFAPTEVGDFTGTITLTTNDPDAKSVVITFKGTGADPNVLVCTPPLDVTEDNCKPGKRSLDFGPTIEKFTRKRFVKISAIGGSDVLLSSATLNGVAGPKCANNHLDQAFVVDAVDNPTRVESQANMQLGIAFTPPCPGEYSAELILETNDPRNPSPRVTLVGVGEQDCVAYSETYTSKITLDNKVDILFIIDDSGSMQDIQDTTKQYAANFVGQLTNPQNPVDFHIGVTTTDMDSATKQGKLMSHQFTSGAYSENIKIITRDSLAGAPNPADRGPVKAFQILVDDITTSGSASEFGLGAAAAALTYGGNYTIPGAFGGSVPGSANISTSADLSKPNGFLRPDARLAIIIISDEDDGGSPSEISTADSATIANYIKTLQGIAGKPGVPAGFKQRLLDNPDENLAVFAIVDPSQGPSQGCPRPAGWVKGDVPFSAASNGTPNYHSGINALGKSGQVISLCSDFSATLSAIGKIIAKASCSFAIQQGQVTIDEANTLCIQGGQCFEPGDYTYTPPADGYPFGSLTIKESKCPQTESAITFDYTSCLRTPDGDKDTVPDLMDNCPFLANTDQLDENSDGIGDVCKSDPNTPPGD